MKPERDAVNEQHNVCPLLVHVTDHVELLHGQPVVVIAHRPVNETNPPRLPPAASIKGRHRHALTQQLPHCLVGPVPGRATNDPQSATSTAASNRPVTKPRIQPPHRINKPLLEHRFGTLLATQLTWRLIVLASTMSANPTLPAEPSPLPQDQPPTPADSSQHPTEV